MYQRVDLLKFALVMTTIALLIFMDASRLYHLIRGQAVIKLYVIFNVLEVCSLGLVDADLAVA